MTDNNRPDALIEALSELDWSDALRLEQCLIDFPPTIERMRPHLEPPGLRPYGRKLLFSDKRLEALCLTWHPHADCLPHDHGQSWSWVQIVEGQAKHTLYRRNEDGNPHPVEVTTLSAGQRLFVSAGLIHSMANPTSQRMVSFHLYAPPIARMQVFDPPRQRAAITTDDCGAWWPDPAQLLRLIRLGRLLA